MDINSKVKEFWAEEFLEDLRKPSIFHEMMFFKVKTNKKKWQFWKDEYYYVLKSDVVNYSPGTIKIGKMES